MTKPAAGEAYGIGTSEPYDIYIWDGVNHKWVNNGVLQGAQGIQGEPGVPGIQGPAGKDGKTPVKGTDYFTQADKQEIAEDAAALVDLSGKQDKIPVTTSDNGKFLRVVNGAWAAATVDNANGVSF